MMELEYIPLKTAEGITCGYAKVRSGTVELSLRAGGTGEAVVLTDGGSFTGSPGARIRTAGRVQAVAVREGEALRCCGLARRSAYTVSEVRLRLSVQNAQKRKSVCLQPRPREKLPPEEKMTGHIAELPESVIQTPDSAETTPDRLAEDGLPFCPDTAIKQALSRLAEETAAAFLEEVHPEPVLPVQMQPLPDPVLPGESERPPALTLEDTAADTEAFSALMARADAVFTKIATPVSDREDVAWDGQARKDLTGPDAMERDTGAWCGAVDRLLRAGVPEPGQIPVQNPFPHIFPGARFCRESGGEAGTLRGEWVSGREHMTVTAVRGDYSPRPPENLPGFTRYIRAKSGGYWVKVEGTET